MPVQQVIHEAHAHGAATNTAARVEGSHRLRYRKPILAGLALTAAGLVGVTANEAGLHSDAQDEKDLYHSTHAGQVEEGQADDLNAPITVESPQSQNERP